LNEKVYLRAKNAGSIALKAKYNLKIRNNIRILLLTIMASSDTI